MVESGERGRRGHGVIAFFAPSTMLKVHALGTIVRAGGMSQIARDTGLGRKSLYRAPSPEGNPEFATVPKVVRARGLKLHAEPEQA